MNPRAYLTSQIDALSLTGWSRRNALNHVERMVISLDLVPGGCEDLLELGAESGLFTDLLRRYSEHNVISSDGTDLDYEIGSLPFEDNRFAIVLLMEVLEHFRCDPMHALSEINRVLRTGGILFLSTPNAASYGAIARALEHESPFLFPVYLINRSTNRHNREYTSREITRLLNAAGFRIAMLRSIDVYGKPHSYSDIEAALDALGSSKENRGDTLFALAEKEGPVVDRYPSWLYL